MVKISDKLGYVYWFAVLVTITCGGTTGVFMTLKNKHEMTMVCQQKYELYETYLLSTDASAATAATTTIMDVSTMTNAKWDTEATNGSRASSLIGIDAMRKNDDGAAGINELVTRVNHIEKMLEWVVAEWLCISRVYYIYDDLLPPLSTSIRLYVHCRMFVFFSCFLPSQLLFRRTFVIHLVRAFEPTSSYQMIVNV